MAITLRGDGDTTFDNNIGIGTTSPGEALHVHATGTTQIAAEFEANNAQSYIEFTSTDSTQILYGRDGADACIQTAGNDVFKALSNGNCSIVDGNLEVANGHGIDFSGTGGSSPTSTLLDDYEEGTFTPSITFGGGNSTQAYSERSGFYTKIGRLISCSILISFTNKGVSTGSAKIVGLPLTVSSNSSARTQGHFTYQTGMANLTGVVLLYGTHNTTETNMMDTNTSSHNMLDDTNFTNSSVFRAILTYYTD